MVDRLGQQRGGAPRPRRRASPASSAPGVRRQRRRARSARAPRPRRPPRPPGRRGCAGPARAQPGDPRDQRRDAGAGGQHLARRAARPARQRHRAGLGACSTPASSGASAFHVLPAGSRGADQARHPRAVQPGRGPARPSARRPAAATQASKASVGSQTGLPSASAPRSPAGRRPTAISTSSAAVGSSTCSSARGRLEVAHASPPLRSAAGGSGPSGRAAARPGVPPRRPRPPRPGRPGPGRASVVASSGTSSRGLAWSCARRAARARPRRAARAGRRRAGHQQPAGEQLLGRGRGVLGQHGVPGACRWSPRRRGRRRARAAPGPRGTSSLEPARPPRRGSAGSARQRPQPAHPGGAARAAPRRRRSAARSPPGDSQARARSTSRSIAAATAAGSAWTIRRQFGLGGLTRDHEGI